MKTGLVMLVPRCMRMLMAYKSMLYSLKKGESAPMEGGFKLSVKLC